MRKVILSVAPISGGSGEFDPEKTAAELIECYKLGATQLHLHVRDEKGKLTADMTLLKKAMKIVRENTDMLIEISTGGVSDLTIEERCIPCSDELTELTSLNVGSINLGDAVYINSPEDVKYCIKETLANGKHPDGEMFEIGHIYTVKALDEEFKMHRPIVLSMVHGFKNCIPAKESALTYMVESFKEAFPGDECYWGIIEANRTNWDFIGKALDMGASMLRVGFEDSMWLDEGVMAESNVDLVKKALEVMKEHGVEPMSPAEARAFLKIG